MTHKPVSASSGEFMHLVQPPDTNILGTIFGGRIMEWIDIAAAIVSFRHCRMTTVTASMDNLHFISPVNLGDIVILKASVNYTHNTSMEIGVRVEAEDRLTGQRRHTASAYLTFVAVDEQKHPAKVPSLICESDEDKRRFTEAKLRREARIKHKPQPKKI